jgi:hypothetical protein
LGKEVADLRKRWGWSGDLKPGVFKLTAVPDPKHRPQVAFYRVTVVKGMHRCWKNIRLFPRGSECSGIQGKPLPVWNKDNDGDWNDAAGKLRSSYAQPDGSIPGINPRLERLEGDVRPRKEKKGRPTEALTVVRVEAAVEDGTDLLVLMLKSFPRTVIVKTGEKIKFTEDGTAHGGSPH